MSFLAPLFLVGGLAVIGPLIFHLIRRTTKDVVPFSSLMFLVATPPRMTKRSRLENLWLLLLRILVVLLLALGFGRPLWQRMTAAGPTLDAGKRTVILVDTSASLRREDLWPRTQARLRELLAGLRDQDGVSLVAFDRTERTLISFDQWAQASPAARIESATQQVDALEPTWAGTALGTALLHASELLNAAPEAGRFLREIVVLSDLQEGSRLDGLQGYEWPRGTEVVLETIQPAHLGNARADWVASDSVPVDAAKATAREPLRVRVTNEANSAREQFQLRWSTGDSAPTVAYVPAGQSRIVTIPPPAAAAGGQLVLSGDETPFDNEAFIVPPRAEQTLLLFAGSEAEGDSQQALYFLRRAFPATQREKIEIVAHPASAALPIGELTLAQLLVLGEGLTEPVVANARRFAEGGRIVLYPLNSAAGAKALGALLGTPELQAEEATVRDYAMLAHLDFQDPLFSAFADPRYSDFSKIHFWKHRRLDAAKIPGARVLAQFDDGDPALLQVPLGKGSVVVLASSWRPSDSQLALSTKFVPLLNALLAESSGRPPRQDQYFVGDTVPMRPGVQPWIISTPGGGKIEAAPGSNFTATNEPGLYSISPGALSFAVNLAVEESRINPLPPERLTALGVPTRGREAKRVLDPASAAQAKRAEDESHQKLWRWLIGTAVVLLLAETLIASQVDHRPRAA